MVDLIYHREGKAALLRQGLAEDHHSFSHAGWMSYWIRGEADAARVIGLFRQIYDWRQQRSSGHRRIQGLPS